ncbi:hypothetical protein B0I37DRAFT_393201 [Chaetomium sp. MPI-CAGE-AT-0009]|nr:hypothetical protein B0I37DRAFT_393201 [Chaetomium sp. MPI-CAGE-AT-0009]
MEPNPSLTLRGGGGPMIILYLLLFLDCSNISNTRIEGLTKDLVTLIDIIQNLIGFFIAHFFLGITKFSLFPSVFYISLFFSATTLFIYNYPETTKFLSEKERTFIRNHLLSDSDATRNKPILSERTGYRAIPIIGSTLFAIIGYIILLTNSNPSSRPGVSYLGTFFAAGGIYPATALALSWPAINVSGQTKRAVANAMQISIGNCGAVLGTQLYRSGNGPRYFVGYSFALGYLIAEIVVSVVLYYLLKRENERREAITPEVQAVGELDDWSGDDDPRWRFQY